MEMQVVLRTFSLSPTRLPLRDSGFGRRAVLCIMLLCRKAPQTKVTPIAEADWSLDCAIETEPNGEAGIDRRLGAALSATHEMPECAGRTSPLENLDTRGRKSPDLQLLFDLTDK